MFSNFAEFEIAALPFINQFSAWALAYRPHAKADHLCYKCASSEVFGHIRATLETESIYTYQSFIAGRRIAILKLHQPFQTALGTIAYIELSDQKPDGSQRSHFDHIEIYPLSGTMDTLAASLESAGIALEKTVRPHHTTYDMSLDHGFSVRIEPDPLIEKIMREEMA